MFRPLHHPIFWSFDMSAWTKVVGLGTSSNFFIWSLKSLGAKIGEKLLWIVVQNSKGQIEKKQLSSWIPVTYLIYGLFLFQLSMSPLFQLPRGVAPDGRRGAMQQPDGQCDARRGTSRQQVSVARRERPGSGGLRGTHRSTSEVLRYGQLKTKIFYP